MPAIFNAGSNAIATVRRLAQGNDPIATALMALMDNTYYASLTAAAEAGNSITVTGQIKDQDGNNVAGIKSVLIKSKPIAGTGLLTDGGNGTVSAGSGTTELWMKTDANGSFQVAVADASAEECLLVVHLDNGTTEMLVLTFA